MCWVNSDRESGQASTFAFRIRDLPALSVALYQRPASVAMQNSWGLLLRTQAIGFSPTCSPSLLTWEFHVPGCLRFRNPDCYGCVFDSEFGPLVNQPLKPILVNNLAADCPERHS